MPEPLGPTQIKNQQQSTHVDQRKCQVIGHAHAWPVIDIAKQVGQGRHHIGPGCNPAEEEVPDDQPMPLRVGDGTIELEIHRLEPSGFSVLATWFLRRPNETNAPRAMTREAVIAFIEDGQTERLGT